MGKIDKIKKTKEGGCGLLMSFQGSLTKEIILWDDLNRGLQNCGAVFEGKGTGILKAMSRRGIDIFAK